MPPHRSHPIGRTALLLSLCFTAWVILFGKTPSQLTAQIGSAECNDGIDNDGDGLIDWQFDLSCVAPNDNSERGVTGQLEKAPGDNGAGWTNFEPSADSRIIYVSSSDGSDTNNGLSPQTPKKTILAATTLLRNGYPDWMLLKRGDTWFERLGPNGQWYWNGRSPTEPVVIASYGSSTARPMIKLEANQVGFRADPNGGAPKFINYVAMLGIEFYAYTRDPSEPTFNLTTAGAGTSAIRIRHRGSDLLFEDNKFSFFNVAVEVQGEQTGDGASGVPPSMRSVSLRRNIVHHQYAGVANGKSQGIFTVHAIGTVIEENILDHNGWNPVSPTASHMLNHNVYLSAVHPDLDQTLGGPAAVKGNISARASANCLQQRLGGETINNLFLDCPLAMFVARHPSIVENNVALGGGDIPGPFAQGNGIDFLSAKSLVVKDNIIAHKRSSVLGNWGAFHFVKWSDLYNGIGPADPMPVQEFLIFTGNIAWNWRSSATLNFTQSAWGPQIDFRDNTFVDPTGTSTLVAYPVDPKEGNWTMSGNRYFTNALPASWVKFPHPTLKALSAWDANGSTSLPTNYPDPNRTIETYMASLGQTPTSEAFLAEARKQSKWGGWRNEFTADAVNDYIRAGFGMTQGGGLGGGSSSSAAPIQEICAKITFTYGPNRAVKITATMNGGTPSQPQTVTPDANGIACIPTSAIPNFSNTPLSLRIRAKGTAKGDLTLTTPLNSSRSNPTAITLALGDINNDGLTTPADALMMIAAYTTPNADVSYATGNLPVTLKMIVDVIRAMNQE